MKNLLMLGILWLTLFTGQEAFAQDDQAKPNNKPQEAAEQRDQPSSKGTLSAVQSQSKKPSDGKPTYKETTDFIKTHFASDFFRDGRNFNTGYKRSGIYFSYHYTVIDVAFTDGCVCIIEYQEKYSMDLEPLDTKTIKRSFDLSLTESFGLVRAGEGGIGVYGLIFNVKNLPSRGEMDLPFHRLRYEDGDSDENLKTLGESKIFKAVNHLRKLCGAPEPIEF